MLTSWEWERLHEIIMISVFTGNNSQTIFNNVKRKMEDLHWGHVGYWRSSSGISCNWLRTCQVWNKEKEKKEKSTVPRFQTMAYLFFKGVFWDLTPFVTVTRAHRETDTEVLVRINRILNNLYEAVEASAMRSGNSEKVRITLTRTNTKSQKINPSIT